MPLFISITKASLLACLDAVTYALETAPSELDIHPTLISTVQGRLCVIYRNNDLQAQMLVACEVMQEGDVTVDARCLGCLVRALPDKQQLHLLLQQNHLVIQAGTSCFRLPALLAPKMPVMEAPSAGMAKVQIDSKRLAKLFAEIAHAIDTMNAYNHPAVIQLAVKDGALWIVAADGFRLAVAREALDRAQIAECEVIVPRQLVQRAKHFLAFANDHVTLAIGSGQLHISYPGGTCFVSKGLAGPFPDWRRIVTHTTQSVNVNSGILRSALAMVLAIIDHRPATINASSRLCSIRFGKTSIEVWYADLAIWKVACGTLPFECEPLWIDAHEFAAAITALSVRHEAIRMGVTADIRSIVLQPPQRNYPLVVMAVLKTTRFTKDPAKNALSF